MEFEDKVEVEIKSQVVFRAAWLNRGGGLKILLNPSMKPAVWCCLGFGGMFPGYAVDAYGPLPGHSQRKARGLGMVRRWFLLGILRHIREHWRSERAGWSSHSVCERRA